MIDWSKLYSRAAALQSAGYTYREIADILTQETGEKITRVAVKSAMRRQKFTRKDDALPDLPDKVKLETKSFAAASDFHVPYHSKTMINHMLAMMTRFDVDTLVINGDLSNQDQISDYPNDSPLQLPFHEEMMLCGDMLVSLDEELSKISKTPRLVITSGNHDERAAKRLGQDVRLEGLIYYMLAGRRLKSELILTSYDHCLINCDARRGLSVMATRLYAVLVILPCGWRKNTAQMSPSVMITTSVLPRRRTASFLPFQWGRWWISAKRAQNCGMQSVIYPPTQR